MSMDKIKVTFKDLMQKSFILKTSKVTLFSYQGLL